MKIYLVVFILAVSLVSLRALAQSIPSSAAIDASLKACTDKSEATLEIVNCYQQATGEWRSQLDRQYRVLLQGQDAEARSKLRHAQCAWLTYQRKYYEGIEAFYRQQRGSIWQIVAAQAKMNIIREKALDLQRLNHSTERSESGTQ